MDPTTSSAQLHALVLGLERDAFVTRFPWFFLLMDTPIATVRGPCATQAMVPAVGRTGLPCPPPSSSPSAALRRLERALLPVRKLSDNFPSMITVGRTVNNDVVLPHATVSRFHAYFRVRRTGLELQDAGSRNGTWIDERRLPARISGGRVDPGARVRFGEIALRFLDAAALWSELNGQLLPQVDEAS